MHAFALRQNPSHQTEFVGFKVLRQVLPAQNLVKVESDSSAKACFAYDFSRIPVNANVPLRIQTKLTAYTPGDNYEQEADRTAEQVIRLPEPQLQSDGPCCKGCSKLRAEQLNKEYSPLQISRVQANNVGNLVAPSIVNEALRSPGKPLESTIISFFEPRFGLDFSQVQVHTDAYAAKSARMINARAFTIGRDIVFGDGQYKPHAPDGKRLLAHELTHVVQQSLSMPILQRQKLSAPSQAESEEFKKDKERWEEAKRRHQEAMKQAASFEEREQERLQFESDKRRFEEAREEHARAIIPPQSIDAFKKAGVKSPRTNIDRNTARLLDVVLRQSNILRRYLRTKIKIAGDKFIIKGSDAEFEHAYRKLHDIRPGSKEWDEVETKRAFYHRKSDTIYLRPRSSYSDALHESIHKFSQSGFRNVFGKFLDEGVTQYFTDIVLEEQGLEKGSSLYGPNLRCAKDLFALAGFGLVAKSYFDGDADLVNFLAKKLNISLVDFHGDSSKWCDKLKMK